MGTEMWRFETAQFSIVWEIDDCFDLDLSWDESGETKENLESGLWQAFDSKVYVEFNGVEIGSAYLGESIYADPSEFRDHIGLGEIASKEKALCDIRKAKSDFAKRIAYCQEKRNSGQWSHRHYVRSTESDILALRDARKTYEHRIRIAGRCGSYFKDMVKEAISEARLFLAKAKKAA